ncbi:uncharacterized protein LOC142336034 isoform X4 [Convolutriloba macropyga]|uniref:uncharacterized protein LOC142336034 isoform X4 n=1 Tax=Convolutriloba macropyga TaxID=536237 RepID=UPI003F51D058
MNEMTSKENSTTEGIFLADIQNQGSRIYEQQPLHRFVHYPETRDQLEQRDVTCEAPEDLSLERYNRFENTLDYDNSFTIENEDQFQESLHKSVCSNTARTLRTITEGSIEVETGTSNYLAPSMGTYESEIASTKDGPIIKQTDFVIGDTATSTVGSGSDPSDIATTNASSLHLLYKNTLDHISTIPEEEIAHRLGCWSSPILQSKRSSKSIGAKNRKESSDTLTSTTNDNTPRFYDLTLQRLSMPDGGNASMNTLPGGRQGVGWEEKHYDISRSAAEKLNWQWDIMYQPMTVTWSFTEPTGCNEAIVYFPYSIVEKNENDNGNGEEKSKEAGSDFAPSPETELKSHKIGAFNPSKSSESLAFEDEKNQNTKTAEEKKTEPLEAGHEMSQTPVVDQKKSESEAGDVKRDDPVRASTRSRKTANGLFSCCKKKPKIEDADTRIETT